MRVEFETFLSYWNYCEKDFEELNREVSSLFDKSTGLSDLERDVLKQAVNDIISSYGRVSYYYSEREKLIDELRKKLKKEKELKQKYYQELQKLNNEVKNENRD